MKLLPTPRTFYVECQDQAQAIIIKDIADQYWEPCEGRAHRSPIPRFEGDTGMYVRPCNLEITQKDNIVTISIPIKSAQASFALYIKRIFDNSVQVTNRYDRLHVNPVTTGKMLHEIEAGWVMSISEAETEKHKDLSIKYGVNQEAKEQRMMDRLKNIKFDQPTNERSDQ